jgi:guanine deaminase
MTRIVESLRSERIGLVSVAVIGILTGVFALGVLAAHRTSPDNSDREESGNREAVPRRWLTAHEIRDRFPSVKHEQFMRRAIANSRTAARATHPGGATGAVVVDCAGQIVADGHNQVVANHDPTWHGEIAAIRSACARLKVQKLEGCTLYTSSEPCPMCLATAYWAGLDGIVYGARIAETGNDDGSDAAFIYEQLARPTGGRSIPEVQLLEDDTLTFVKDHPAVRN